MEPLSTHRQEEQLVAERAADWLRRLPTADAAERKAFMAWLRESPRHVREILLATTWDKVLEAFDAERRVDLDALFEQGSAEIISLDPTPRLTGIEKPPPQLNTMRRRYRRLAGLAAAAVLMCVAIWVPLKILDETYSTPIGEQRAFALEDGSMIHLNAHSTVEVNFSDQVREVHLLEGQAIFKVRHDATRPFRVYVNGAFIQAIGTQFDVQRLTGQTNVSVIEGKVGISRDVSSAEPVKMATLVAGETASITTRGKVTAPSAVTVADATAWQQRRLVFRKRTLADMALEFNRYNRSPQIRIEGDALRERQFNGVFDADDPESLVRFLDGVTGIGVEQDGKEIVIRAR